MIEFEVDNSRLNWDTAKVANINKQDTSRYMAAKKIKGNSK